MTSADDDIKMGETVSAILRNVETGEKRIIGSDGPKKQAKYKVDIKITDLRTGAIHTFEETR